MLSSLEAVCCAQYQLCSSVQGNITEQIVQDVYQSKTKLQPFYFLFDEHLKGFRLACGASGSKGSPILQQLYHCTCGMSLLKGRKGFTSDFSGKQRTSDELYSQDLEIEGNIREVFILKYYILLIQVTSLSFPWHSPYFYALWRADFWCLPDGSNNSNKIIQCQPQQQFCIRS